MSDARSAGAQSRAPALGFTLEKYPALLGWLRAAALALGAALWSWPLTVWLGVAAACAGAIAGSRLAERVASSAVRTASALLLAALAALAFGGASGLLVRFALPGSILGVVGVLHVHELLFWFGAAAWATFSLRIASARRPAFALLEVLFTALALALSFAAHRQGLVHRPLAIGDWAWSRGIDPAGVLLLLGAGGTLLLAVFLISERYGRRLWIHFGVLVAIGLALLGTVRITGLPRTHAGDEFGLTGDPSEEKASEGQQGDPNNPAQHGLSQPDFPFRDDYRSQGGQAPVAVVLLHDDYSPESDVYYFRQSALSQFNGNRLVQAMRADADRDIMTRFPAKLERVPEIPGIQQRRRLDTTIGLLVDHVRPFALDSPESFAPRENPNSMRFVRVFEAVSQVQTTDLPERLGHRAGAPDWTPELREHYTQYPADPRYRELAERIVGEKLRPEYRQDPLGKALAIKGYLDEKGTYSLRSKHASAADPTADFLFGDLTGYCVHFSHAAVYLLRSLGIPARVGVGYAVPESDRGQSSSILIRALNAHAWPEIYLEGLGWTVVDLAPAQTLDQVPTPPDQSLQSMLGDMLRMKPGAEDEYMEAQRILPTLAQVLWAAAAALGGVLLFGLAVKGYRASVPALAPERSQYRLQYRATLDRLAEIGARRRFGETREQFAARVAPLAPSFRALTVQHLGWALGSRRLAQRSDLSALRASFGREIRSTVPVWRRAIGLFNPFSWMFAR